MVVIIADSTLHMQVPVRVAGGLLFELLGQSAGDPFAPEIHTSNGSAYSFLLYYYT